MADHHSSGGRYRHLDASGPREVVYCHACEAEWYRDEHEHSLICPECESEVTEIITPESDPRPVHQDEQPPPDFLGLHEHNPWDTVGHDSDPEEADIEEHITHGPGGSMFFSRTIRSSGPRGTFGDGSRQRRAPPNDADAVMMSFQNMVGSLMGPGFRPGQAGRSGPDTLFNDRPYPGGFQTFGSANGGPSVVGGRFTFSNIRPRNTDGPQPGAPPVDDLATIIGSIFGPGSMGGAGGDDHAGPGHPAQGGMPPGLQALFAAMLNPANARSGDAVYSQEALDQIISTLMEQHPTSNAPGPASPDAIASLPKKNLDEKMLGPEGKGECSVCMDDVHTGDEVVCLPCSHWFHETCASAWLSEHNTCPICRKGIDGEPSPGAGSSSSARENSNSTPSNDHRSRHLSAIRSPPRLNRSGTGTGRNEARLDAIRNIGRVTPAEEETPRTRRWQVVGETTSNDPSSSMPGSYSSSPRFRDDDREQRDYRDRDRRDRESRSDHSRISRRSSQQSNVSSRGESGSGPMSWLRDRFGSNSRHHDN